MRTTSPGDQTQGNDARGVYVNAVFADPSAVVFVNYAQDGVRQSCDRPERGIRSQSLTGAAYRSGQ